MTEKTVPIMSHVEFFVCFSSVPFVDADQLTMNRILQIKCSSSVTFVYESI